jgi:hypothetical protein
LCRNVHLSGGVGISRVLQLMQVGPTNINDACLIGPTLGDRGGLRGAPGLCARHVCLHRLKHQNCEPRQGRELLRRGAAALRGGFGNHARISPVRQTAGTKLLLRGHCQAGGPSGERKDLDQRASQRLILCRVIATPLFAGRLWLGTQLMLNTDLLVLAEPYSCPVDCI